MLIQALLCCLCRLSSDKVPLYVYVGHDIVSDQLKGSAHAWEPAEVQEMLWALQQFDSPTQRQAAAAISQSLPGLAAAARWAAGRPASSTATTTSNKQQLQKPLFVDVGANVGWFMLNAAAAGARVAAFEGVWVVWTCVLVLHA